MRSLLCPLLSSAELNQHSYFFLRPRSRTIERKKGRELSHLLSLSHLPAPLLVTLSSPVQSSPVQSSPVQSSPVMMELSSSSSRARGFKLTSWTPYFITCLYYLSLQVHSLRILPMRMASSAPKSDRNELSKPKREFRTLRGMPCTGLHDRILYLLSNV